jgi:hypothetical protein
MVEIYLNKLRDVFATFEAKKELKRRQLAGEKAKWEDLPDMKAIMDTRTGRVVIPNVVEKAFDAFEDCIAYCDEAEKVRKVRKTGLNDESSRSHLVFAITITATEKKSKKTTVGKLSLVSIYYAPTLLGVWF